MKRFVLKKGLDLPIEGAAPGGEISNSFSKHYGILGDDYIGIKPRILVEEGDTVGAGAPLMVHKDLPEVHIVAPVSGRIKMINRGARRKLISIEIEEDQTAADPIDFSGVGGAGTAEEISAKLCAAGLWTSFRTRPYSKVPEPAARPAAIYVTATDTEPLAPDPAPIIAEEPEAFTLGLESITKLTDGATYLCQADGAEVPGADIPGIEAVAFSGTHPAGLAGTHMHFLEPPDSTRTVWTISYADVLVIGRLLLTGHFDGSRVISLAGPICRSPRLIRTSIGASMLEVAEQDLPEDRPARIISGSVLSGRAGIEKSAYLGRYARQITLIEEDTKQIPMGWIRPMFEKYAVQPVLGSAMSGRRFPLTSNLNGGRRAMVPLGTFEELMPQDFLPTQLLRALLVMDTDQAQALGALELDEEDLGLVGFACPAKYEYGMALRDCLTKIEIEG
ncbi:MAG: Na(+)-translocating NADH-quinone reductase subunit A [Pseudomonadota bacterium]